MRSSWTYTARVLVRLQCGLVAQRASREGHKDWKGTAEEELVSLYLHTHKDLSPAWCYCLPAGLGPFLPHVPGELLL
jgi:hypothetical protein